MNIYEAEKIVREYGKWYSDPSGIRQKTIDKYESLGLYQPFIDVFALPYAPARLKQAFYIWTEHLYKSGELEGMEYGDNSYLDTLVMMYSFIDSEFQDEAEEINEARLALNKLESTNPKIYKLECLKLAAKYGLRFDYKTNSEVGFYTKELEGRVEFKNFLADVSGGWQQGHG